MKTTIVYAAKETSVAYRAAANPSSMNCLCEILGARYRGNGGDLRRNPEQSAEPRKVADVVNRYFAESEKGHRANVATLGNMLRIQFPGISDGWIGHSSLSQLLKKVCQLKIENIENRTLAWKE